MNQNIFEVSVYNSCLKRIEEIKEDSKPKWGKMNAAQMFRHCSKVQNVMNGEKIKSPFFMKLALPIIKRMVIKGDYSENSKTHPHYKTEGIEDFEKSKRALLISIKEFIERGIEKNGELPHPIFGKMTSAEKGRVIYMHLDHHLRQFGV